MVFTLLTSEISPHRVGILHGPFVLDKNMDVNDGQWVKLTLVMLLLLFEQYLSKFQATSQSFEENYEIS